jgi:hypothetical protein
VPYAQFGDPQSLNLYSYVENAPVNRVDSTGHFLDDCNACDHGDSGFSVAGDAGSEVGLVRCSTCELGTPPSNQQKQSAQQLASQVPDDVKDAIDESVKASNSPTQDDKKGGMHEEGGVWGTTTDNKTVVVPAKPGPAEKPGEKEVHIDPGNSKDPSLKDNLKSVDGAWHVHPKGHGDVQFVQPPSKADKDAALTTGTNIVVGAADKKVYFYNNSGGVGEMSLKDFMRTK